MNTRRWPLGALALTLLLLVGLLVPWAGGRAAATPSTHSLTCAPGLGTGSPGVTRTEIKIAAISTLTGILAADFGSLVPGIKAYFDMVDAHGGVDGRKIVLAYDLDDAGLASQFQADTRTAIDQDHAFAVAVSSYWFTPSYFVATCTPTYGYNVDGNWAGAPNLFAAGGSVLTLKTVAPATAYLIDETRSKSVAILAYSVSTSSDLCRTTGRLLRAAGYHVSFTDLRLPPIDANLTPDVQRIQHAGADFVISCMTVTGNVELARDIQEYGLHVHQLWFDGADATVVKKYKDLLQGVYFDLLNVPESAARVYPGVYPGLETYLKAMRRYSPGYADNALALDGWESAALMVAGIRAAGRHLTQAAVVAATNRLTAFTAGGLEEPIDWETAHFASTRTACSAFEEVKGAAALPVLGKGKEVFVCFRTSDVRHPKPIAPPRGIPGPQHG
ncbi:MAG: ABC transporter substrate-binding protein [Actinomycetota bacterium]|nr:ABC transporter substrate-binding protein [Actinomycetota bacterium]